MNWTPLFGQEVPTGDIVQWVRDGGMISLLLVAIVGAIRQWWVPGWQYRQTLSERDEYRSLALRGLQRTEESLSIAEDIAAIAEPKTTRRGR